MDLLIELWPVLIFIVFVAAFLFFVISKKGKGMMFGGEIIHTINGNPQGKRRIITTGVKVHVVQAAPMVRFVGLEINQSGGLSWQMIPISLPISDARLLADMINQAIDYEPQ